MSDETTLLREKLNKLIIEIERLDIKLDSPAYDMTLGEYEQEREKLLDEFEQAIADELNATLGAGTCRNVDEDPMYFCCSKCGSTCTVEYGDGGYGRPSFCPSCGRKVVDE